MRVYQIFLIVILANLTYNLNCQKVNESKLFILDASGSMWAKLENSAKIQIAKKSITDLIYSMKETENIGLMVYGHRQEKDCNDIELLIDIMPINKKQIEQKLLTINPKGRTPIANAIREGISVLKNRSQKSTIILLSDGLETCEGNACELIALARKSGMDIKVHVIGYGIEDIDQSQLECIAQAGNGFYIPANNSIELSNALKTVIHEVKEGDAYLSIKSMINEQLKDASIVLKSDKLEKDLSIRTYEDKSTNPRILMLPSGIYTFDINPIGMPHYPPITVENVVLVSGDTSYHHIDFKEGEIQFKVTRNGELSDALIKIYIAGTDSVVTNNRTYKDKAHNPAKIKLRPGNYDIGVTSIEIENKPTIKLTNQIIGNKGQLSFNHDFHSSVLSIGAKKENVLIDALITIKSKANNKTICSGRTYESSKSNPNQFILEPGNYSVELKSIKPKGLSIKNFEIQLAIGEKVERILTW